MRKLILLSGKAQHGKDSACDILSSQLRLLGFKTHKTAIAKHLKDIMKEYYNWDGAKTDEARSLLQYLGTDRIRNDLKNPFFHCERTMENIEVVQKDFHYIFVPDARFPNEAYFAKAYFPNKVIHIKVNRLDFKSPLTALQQQHHSECAMNQFRDYDHILNAKSGLKQLEYEIKKANILEDILS